MLAALVLTAALLFSQSDEPAASPTASTEEPIPPGMMRCVADLGARVQMCTTSEGEVLRCRRERVLGSRLPQRVCLSYRDDQRLHEESRDALDRQQHIAPPG